MPVRDGSRSPVGRTIALIVAVTGLTYIGIQVLGGLLGWSNRIMGLFDLIALAIFGWAVVTAFLIWRRGQSEPGQGDEDSR